MNLLTRRWVFAAGLATLLPACFLMAPPCAAADDAGGITVSGVGTVKAKPSIVEIEGTLAGEGELSEDAKVKYADARKKVLASLDALKDPDLSITWQGVGISEATDPNAQMQMMRGMAAASVAKQRVRVSESVKLTLKNVDKLPPEKVIESVLKVIDTSRDSGLKLGPSAPSTMYEMQMRAQFGGGGALVNFLVPDKAALEGQAYEKAVDDARAKARQLAELNGVQLGGVLSVQEADEAGPANPNAVLRTIVASQMGGRKAEEAASPTLTEIPISVHLLIRFGIQR